MEYEKRIIQRPDGTIELVLTERYPEEHYGDTFSNFSPNYGYYEPSRPSYDFDIPEPEPEPQPDPNQLLLPAPEPEPERPRYWIPLALAATALLVSFVSYKFFFSNADNIAKSKFNPILFEKVVTIKDADEYGRIKVFKWGANGEKIGDLIEFTANGEFKIYQGPGRWETANKSHVAQIKTFWTGKWLGVWIPKNVELTVRLKRQTNI